MDTPPSRPAYGWYIGTAIITIIAIGVAIYFAKRPTTAPRSSSAANVNAPQLQNTLNSMKETLESVKSQIQPPVEVFQIQRGTAYSTPRTEAANVCADYGARLATMSELTEAQKQGAQWCSSGWVSDNENGVYPMQQEISGCGTRGVNTFGPRGNVNCIGAKPRRVKDGDRIWDWNGVRYSQFGG